MSPKNARPHYYEGGWDYVAAEAGPSDPHPTLKQAELARRLMAHAEEHYYEGGWDYVVETYTLEELAEELAEEGITTWRGARKYFRETMGLRNERREDVRSQGDPVDWTEQDRWDAASERIENIRREF